MAYPNPSPLVVSGSSNSLSRVLCNFPSQYLFAIGLQCVFSFRRNSSPILHCTLKQCDSAKATSVRRSSSHNRAITFYGSAFQHFNMNPHLESFRYTTPRNNRKATRFSVELLPLHSQLLRESLLLSFPPLTDMLKFSGLSHPS